MQFQLTFIKVNFLNKVFYPHYAEYITALIKRVFVRPEQLFSFHKKSHKSWLDHRDGHPYGS